MIKKIILLTATTFCIGLSVANSQVENKIEDWYNSSKDRNGVYGAEVDKAHEMMSKKKAGYKPVVAIIGGGIDCEHIAIKDNIWINKAEKIDGKDNDSNGLIDDVNGWNFISNRAGVTMEKMLSEGDREWLRLRDKYQSILTGDGGKTFFTFTTDGEKKQMPAPEDMNEYNYYKYTILKESANGRASGSVLVASMLKHYANEFNKQIRERNPDREMFTQSDLIACWDKTKPLDSLMASAMVALGYGFSIYKTDNWNVVYNIFSADKSIEKAKQSAIAYANITDNRDKIVGDKSFDINDKIYGSNNLLTDNSANSTMVAGIISGKRGVVGYNNAICPNAQIMPLVVMTKSGEPYLKDIALAIRYAVDNKADIIILPQQNTLYPEGQRKWVAEAIAYAETKGALVIVPAWELSYDLSQKEFFPNRRMIEGKELKNIMVVSSSTPNGTPVLASNYGKDELDIFAPGVNLKTTYIGDTFKLGTGPAMAAATVAGVAALIKSYYPKLSGVQIRTLINENSTSREGVEVEKGIIINEKTTQDIFLFDELCISKGIINAHKALEAAGKLINKK